MARIKPSAIISNISGKIAGSTFQSSQGGLIVKAKNKLARPNSPSQTRVNSITAVVQMEWESLTTDERATWQAYAVYAKQKQKNSNEFIVNGQQLFIKRNVIRLLYGKTLLSEPIFSPITIAPVSFTVQFVTSNLALGADRTITSTAEFIVMFATIPVRKSINNPGSRYRLLDFNTTTNTQWIINNEYNSVFGFVPSASSTLFFKVYSVDLVTGASVPASIIKVNP